MMRFAKRLSERSTENLKKTTIMAQKILQKIKNFETHHKIIAFLAIMVSTVAISRLIPTFLFNPNPVLLNLEVHHLDYGVLILIMASLLLLFGPPKKYYFYFFMVAVSIGLIIDEYWFIRKNVVEKIDLQNLSYESTFSSALILAVVIILLIFFIDSITKRYKK